MNKIALINGSPKVVLHRGGESASYRLLQAVRHAVRREDRRFEFEDFHLKIGNVPNDDYKEMLTCDTWVLSFPIYTGAIPAHMMMFMERLRNLASQFPARGTPTGMERPICVYAMANGELYEGNEAEAAFEMLAFWCDECGFQWGNGLGVGGGPVLLSSGSPIGHFRFHHAFARCLAIFTTAIRQRKSVGNLYFSPDISKKSYVMRINRLLRRQMERIPKDDSL